MADNPILVENLKPGTPQSVWDAPATTRIEGFATDISVDQGETVSFKINLDATPGANIPYRIEIYRLGYYGGDGATLVTTLSGLQGGAQPDPITDARGVVDAGNWTVSAQWDSPEDAVSGVYLAKLVRDDDGSTNQIPFILREDDPRADGSRADIVLQTSDTTWQAYNGWGGRNGELAGNLYGGFDAAAPPPPDAGPFGTERADAVSYNRPITTRDGGGFAAGAQDYLFGADYAAIYWLEAQGYDVAYISGVDADRLGPDALLGHQAYISVGHDEYWSGAQRANVEAARDAGVNLLFWGGNDVYWKTRFEDSIDGSATAYRTLVSHKETWNNYSLTAGPEDYADVDPSSEWTGTWRDLRFVGAVDGQGNPTAEGAIPENALTGQLFLGDGTSIDTIGLDVPADLAGLRFWRDTGVAGSGVTNLAPGIIGYEWNTVPDDEFRPAGLIKLSNTLIETYPAILVDQGNRTAPGSGEHALSLYRAASGALVFGAGSVFWSWGLSDRHDSSPYGVNIENATVQQFTVNMFADMGIQPGVSDLVLASRGLLRATASADAVAASITLDDIPDEIVALQTYVITGTATDDDGVAATEDGTVAMVEVSFDDGLTWRPAEGRTTWSYAWAPTETGAYEIRVRAIDDSLNLPDTVSLPGDSVTVTTAPLPDTVSLFDAAPVAAEVYDDGSPLEVGVRVEAAQAGVVTELRYWRHASDADDTDIRAGHLWGPNGALLATAQFVSAPGASGWQFAALDVPVVVTPGQTYTASYRTDDAYVSTGGFFAADYTEPFGQLTAPVGTNGVYRYGADLARPEATYNAANYWVDVTFDRGVPGNLAPVITSAPAVSVQENGIFAAQLTAQDPEGGTLTWALAGGPDAGLFTVSQTGALRFATAPDFEAPSDANGDNVYLVSVSVSDGIAPPVAQDLVVTVTDVEPEVAAGPVVTVFDGPALGAVANNDGTPVELGMRVTPSQTGTVTELRYWRDASDAGDTDLREGRLWDASGQVLATVGFASGPGESGWQTAALPSPILLVAGRTYTVSYRTDDAYVATVGFFDTPQTGAGGVLTAPAASNGVYSYGTAIGLPTNTYSSSNYWVDLGFSPGLPDNAAPVLTSPATYAALENGTAVGPVTATDADRNVLSYQIAGGVDAARFAIDAGTGALRFVTAPDFEAPGDANADNAYGLVVAVSDGIAAPVTQAVTVTVTDQEPEAQAPTFATLYEDGEAPQLMVTTDPTTYELGVRFDANVDGAVVELRYWRGAADAGDTDIRTLRLWDAQGNPLASVDVTSAPGETGWQIGTLATPVALAAGGRYVASYGTDGNYVATSDDFVFAEQGTGGLLTAPAGDNGVFAAGAPGLFPTQSYNSTNYWVDVGFDAGFDALALVSVQAEDTFL